MKPNKKRKQLLLSDFILRKKQKQNDAETNMKQQIQACGNHPNLIYIPKYFSEVEQKELILNLDKIDWQRVKYEKRGTVIKTPRLTFCYGKLENGQEQVEWNGKYFKTEVFPSWLQDICNRIQIESGLTFNACILNCYEDGNDSISMHTDAEQFLAHKNVASISLGQARFFKYRTDQKILSILLESGSLTILANGVEHSVPKVDSNQSISKRYNITLRNVKGEKGLGNYYYYNRGEAYQVTCV